MVKLRGSGSFYEVLTPAGMASVHGTAFQVDVNPLDGVRYVVDHGEVAVRQGNAAVTLTAGQATLVATDGIPDDPPLSSRLRVKSPRSMEMSGW